MRKSSEYIQNLGDKMEAKKNTEQQKIVVHVQETALFKGMCDIINEMYNDKRIPDAYKTRIKQLFMRSVK